MLETFGRFLVFLGQEKKQAKKNDKKHVNPAVLVPAIVGGTLVLAGTAFLVYKLVEKKREQAIAEAQTPEDEFFEDENG